MRGMLLMVVSGLLIALACAALPKAAGSESQDKIYWPDHLVAAEKIASQIAPEDNAYAYTDAFIRWKGYDGATRYENRSDCSMFFNLLMRHSYRISETKLKEMTGHERPTARAWFEAIEAGKTKQMLLVVPRLADVLPGDVLFVRYPEGSGDTGHVMILADKPVAREATKPLAAGTRQWEVPVVDSSKNAHGPQDTRHKGEGKVSQGVGRGTLRLYTFEDGTLAGYTWSTQEISKFEPVFLHQLLLTRVRKPDVRH